MVVSPKVQAPDPHPPARALCGSRGLDHQRSDRGERSPRKGAAMQGTATETHGTAMRFDFRDPVCGMRVSEDAPHRKRIGDVEYRFCSSRCLERFATNPSVFLEEDARR